MTIRRERALIKRADALHQCLREREAVALLEEAVALLRTVGDRRALALGLIGLSLSRSYLDEPGCLEEPVTEALALLDDDPSPELVRVLSYASTCLSLDHEDFAAAAALADRALRLASQLDLPVDVRALGARAVGRTHTGDRLGLDDYRRGNR